MKKLAEQLTEDAGPVKYGTLASRPASPTLVGEVYVIEGDTAANNGYVHLANAAKEWLVIGSTHATEAGVIYEPGDLKMSAATTVPTGWLACEGQEVNRTTFKKLFEAISTAYGEGNKSTTFNVPDYRGRSPLGAGTGPELTARTVGQKLGSELLQSHSHTIEVGDANNTGVTDNFPNLPVAPHSRVSALLAQFNSTRATSTVGSGSSGNMPPSTVCNIWIKT